MLTLSWIALIVSCLGYGTASVLQSIGARRVATATGLTGLASIAAQLFGDQVNAGFGLAAVLGFVLAATGMTALMRFAA